jgi:cytoskeleton protein RodZ
VRILAATTDPWPRDRFSDVQTDFPAPVEGSSGVGNILRRARERRGLSLQDASQATRIWTRYLQALEDDAPSDNFPAPVYGRFFLREYARYLNIPDGPLVEALDARWGTEPPDLHVIPSLREPRRWAGRLTTTAALLALLLIVAFAVATGSRSRGGRDIAGGPPSTPPGVALGSVGRTHPVTGHAGSGYGGIVATLTVKERCWVRAEADGQIVEQRTYQPGQRLTLRAHRSLLLDLGNAPGVDLVVNGRSVPSGAVAVRQLSIRYLQGRAVIA